MIYDKKTKECERLTPKIKKWKKKVVSFNNKQNINNQVDFMETERIVIADLLSWSDLKKSIYTMLFKLMMIKFYGDYLKTFTIHEVA